MSPSGTRAAAPGYERREPDGWRWVTTLACFHAEYLWVNPGDLVPAHSSTWTIYLEDVELPLDGEYRYVAILLDTDVEDHVVRSESFFVEAVDWRSIAGGG